MFSTALLVSGGSALLFVGAWAVSRLSTARKNGSALYSPPQDFDNYFNNFFEDVKNEDFEVYKKGAASFEKDSEESSTNRSDNRDIPGDDQPGEEKERKVRSKKRWLWALGLLAGLLKTCAKLLWLFILLLFWILLKADDHDMKKEYRRNEKR